MPRALSEQGPCLAYCQRKGRVPHIRASRPPAAPYLPQVRPWRCSHALLDAAALRAQRCGPTFMTVRLIAHHHEWPLQPLQLPPLASPPSCLDAADRDFYSQVHRKLLPAEAPPLLPCVE